MADTASEAALATATTVAAVVPSERAAVALRPLSSADMTLTGANRGVAGMRVWIPRG
jgi:hypothetical protein